MNEKVKVLIPLYKADLTNLEDKSLKQCCKILSGYPLVVIKPVSLNIDHILQKYSILNVENFNDCYFNGIQGYNSLMLSKDLYGRFLDTEYVLIYQLDAYVFRDELNYWVEKGYDYIGAPWILKPKQRRLYYRVFLKIKSIFYTFRKKPFNINILADKVGNGGFSLRKVKSHYIVTKEKRERINFYLERSLIYNVYNEDVFWATENNHFHYPEVFEGIKFSVDKYPELCYKWNCQTLPFGCHGWFRPNKYNFWKQFIHV